MNWAVVGASILPALLAGTEIGLITAGAAGERGWGMAWMSTAAGLATRRRLRLCFISFSRICRTTSWNILPAALFFFSA